ncbi:hypothetical protein D1007_20064 [Hordeum vulgare]|nr:hypothetical protein D1007_20064 [Hordeum vulgare]
MPPSSQPKRPASALAPALASASELAPQAASARAPQAGPAPPPAGPVAPPVRPASALLLRPAPPRPAAGRPRRPARQAGPAPPSRRPTPPRPAAGLPAPPPAGPAPPRRRPPRPASGRPGPAPPTLQSAPPRLLSMLSMFPAVNMEKVKEPKANWDSAAHTIYMTACVEEVRGNNRSGSFLSDIGQANLHKKFNERSGRNYSTRQIKNRWSVCRSDYNTWKTLIQQASGLGRDEHTKTIAATNEWWALEIKAHPEVAKFRYAPLAEEEKMSEVFDNCCVTNEHARVPTPSYQGDPSRIILEDDSGCESQDCQVTPIQNRGKSGKKRASPYSPSPKMNDKWAGENAKNEAFVRMVDLFSARDKRDVEESARDKREAEERAREKREPEESVDQTRQEIQHMMAMVEADGAKPGSDEHFYATFLFMEKKYRDVFSSFTAHEPIARLGWIKRMWQLNNK